MKNMTQSVVVKRRCSVDGSASEQEPRISGPVCALRDGPVKIAHLSETLLAYICSFPDVRFPTVPEYVGELRKAVGGRVAAPKAAREGID